MKTSRTEEMFCLASGALLGVAAMYFLDPDAGQRRRRRAAAAAEGAYDQARHAVGETWDEAKDLTHRVIGETTGIQKQAAQSAHALADEAREIAHNLASRAQVHGSHLHDLTTGLWHRVRDLGSKVGNLGSGWSHRAASLQGDLSDRAHDWSHWFSKRAARTSGQARSWLKHQQRHEGFGGGTVLSSAIGCCAIGAGAMYFLDPNRGPARRDRITKSAGTLLCNTGHTMRATGQAMADTWKRLFRGSGQSSNETKSVDSEELVRRIRSEIRWYSPNVEQLQLMADREGTVTVTGNIPEYEVDTLLALLHRISGVTHVVNRLNQSETTEPAPQHRAPSSAVRR